MDASATRQSILPQFGISSAAPGRATRLLSTAYGLWTQARAWSESSARVLVSLLTPGHCTRIPNPSMPVICRP